MLMNPIQRCRTLKGKKMSGVTQQHDFYQFLERMQYKILYISCLL